jgi:hypothetical protein
VSAKGTPETLATTLGGGKAGDGTFAQHVALDLRNGAKHGVEHLSRRGARVDMLGQRSQSHASFAQRFSRVEQMPQAPPEPIELPDDEGIARCEIRDRGLESRSRSQRSRCGILVNDGATGGAQCVELQRRCLFIRRHACVADQAR